MRFMAMRSPVLALLAVTAVTAVAASSLGCIVEDGPPRRLADHGGGSPSPVESEGSSSGGASPAPNTPSSPSAPAPMLAVIDTDQVMTAQPGEGVGVFTEYMRGGKWRVWWTCDTAQTGQDCDFSVIVSTAAGTLSEVNTSSLAGGQVGGHESRIEAHIRTSNQVHEVTFSTNPGAIITLEASVGGIEDGAFLFFVQDGKVNGGFAGKLTNPLQLQGNTP